MWKPRLNTTIAAAMAALVVANVSASACGYENDIGAKIAVIHPGSIDVAIAIREAIDDGILPASAAKPVVPGQTGYWRAVGRLTELQHRLSAVPSAKYGASLSTIFIDSKLWSRFIVTADDVAVEVHTVGPKAGDVVLVTSEAVLAEALSGQMPITLAFDRGLMRFNGAPGAIDGVREHLALALGDSVISAADTPIQRAPTIRFFGPSPAK